MFCKTFPGKESPNQRWEYFNSSNFASFRLILSDPLHQVEEMLATADKNHDGTISYSEFRVSCLVLSSLRQDLRPWQPDPQVMLGAAPLFMTECPRYSKQSLRPEHQEA